MADPARERARFRERRAEILGETARRQAMLDTARWPHPDYLGESGRDRAERLHRTAGPVPFDDGSGVIRYVAG